MTRLETTSLDSDSARTTTMLLGSNSCIPQGGSLSVRLEVMSEPPVGASLGV